MDHLADDRPRADDRDLDDQVVEAPGPEARERRHLGAALHLEEPDRVGRLEEPVHRRVVGRQMREVHLAAGGPAELDRLFEGRHHPEPEEIHLDDPEIGAVVLVPLHDDPARHRRRLERHHLVEPARREHHAARVLAEVAREPDDGVPERGKAPDPRIREIGAGAPEVPGGRLLIRIPVAPAGDVLGEPVEEVRREAERFPDLADRAPRLVGDDVGSHRGAGPAVALVDVLDDRLAAVPRREVEIDVGPFPPLLREEALEEEVHPDRVHGRDAEAVADRAVRRRAPALDEDPPRARLADDVPDDQEVAGEVELLDETELPVELLTHARRHGAIPAAGAGGDELAEVGALRPSIGHRIGGEAIPEILEGEAAARGDLAGRGHGRRKVGEAAGHLGRGPEVALGVRRQA